jgi:CBS domain containing-hemolysin-like protein
VPDNAPGGKAEPVQTPDRPTTWFENTMGALRTLLRGRGDTARLRESLEGILEESEGADRELAREERSMLLNLLNFGELQVVDVMVPRADIVAVEVDTPLAELVKIFRDAQHSRLPVYRDTLDNPIGMVHIKELIGLALPDDGTRKPKSISDVRRDVLFVPPSMPVVDLLVKMQATRIHLALVIDEYGGTDGLVSIEDLVEQIVGDIEDEHDIEESLLMPRKDGGFEASARTPREDVEKAIGFPLVDEEQAEEIDTLAGLVFSLVGRVPQRGEILVHPAGVEFEVLDADPRRLKRLLVRRTKPKEEPAAQSVVTSEKPREASAVVNG